MCVLLCFIVVRTFNMSSSLSIFYYFILLIYLFFWLHCTAGVILIPQPAIEPVYPAVEAWSLNNWTAREVPLLYFNVHTAILTIATVL